MPNSLNFVDPKECKQTNAVPEGEDWQYELKLDGSRAIAVNEHGEVALYSRNGSSFNDKFPFVSEAIRMLEAKSFILDDELVALDEQGRPSFSLLQNI